MRIISPIVSTSSSVNRRVIRRLVEINSRTVSIMSRDRTAVGSPLRDFHDRAEILHTIQKPAYERQHCFVSWKVSVAIWPFLNLNLVFALCSITTNSHNHLHSMNDEREVTDLVQGTWRKNQLSQTSWNMFLRAFMIWCRTHTPMFIDGGRNIFKGSYSVASVNLGKQSSLAKLLILAETLASIIYPWF
jgi:hypothetical protein